jgi:hypothetical protein
VHATRVRGVVLSGVLIVALTPVIAAAADGTSKMIGGGVRLKGTTIWYAHGKAVGPRTISARVIPVPPQAVKVQWAVVCQKPNSYDPSFHLATDVKSGEVSVPSVATVKLVLPYPKPHTCVASVYATLERGGKLTLRILQT